MKSVYISYAIIISFGCFLIAEGRFISSEDNDTSPATAEKFGTGPGDGLPALQSEENKFTGSGKIYLT